MTTLSQRGLQPQPRIARPLREYGGLALGLAVVQGILLAIDAGPYFYSDSAAYLFAAHDLTPSRSRPIGVSIVWRSLLYLHRSPLTLVIAQALLMILAAVLMYAVAREIGVGRRMSTVCAAVICLSPTSLLFERLLLSESLAAVGFAATAFCLVKAATTRRKVLCGAAGVAAAITVLSRSSFELMPIGAALGLLLLWPVRQKRQLAAVVVSFSVACALPVATYMLRSQQILQSFSISPWSGMVAIARAAPWVDCSRPEAPPPIRSALCREGVPHWTYDEVLWRPGVVDNMLGEPLYQFNRDNRQLKDLAIQAIARHPGDYLLSVITTGADDLALSDPELSDYDAAPSPTIVTALRENALPSGSGSQHRLFHLLRSLQRPWYVVRWLMLLGICLSVVGWRRLTRGRAVIALAVTWFAAVVPAVALGGPAPRYVFSLESVGWVLAFAAVAAVRGASARVAAKRQWPAGSIRSASNAV